MNALTATRPATATGLTASVVIAAYSSERWEHLRAAVASVAAIIAGLGLAVAGCTADPYPEVPPEAYGGYYGGGR